MLFLRRRIKDGAGENAPVLMSSDLPAGTNQDLRETVELARVGTMRASVWGSAWGAVVFTGIFSLMDGRFGWRPLAEGSFVFLGSLALSILVPWPTNAKAWRAVIPACLSAGLCPSCGYRLDGPSDDAGLRRCAECGHRWGVAEAPRAAGARS